MFPLRPYPSVPALAALLAIAGSAHAAGDPASGAVVFKQCSGCHALNGTARIGPPLQGVVGRRAGTIPNVHYSAALSASDITWTAEQLDRFLASPGAVVPGTIMGFHLTDPKQRADVIAYLEQAGRP